ncbi:XRE family transcriptional regulator [Limnobaculum zhutongyuii]|uniref:XRE family transcriptional regulator n=1 Tax=Limnobaculum zhutongyuii TaxID=2498113 RepID=A0A411WRM3_9GAMM|nr:helix-turn-helix transcriptional regulator [Limnobaculum zhutongyuii]QBH98790.1 XRE family transcriptional regulator [Limnobaculum zhutongyuii]TQS90843.1 XRE family transcriptional regulator [Limnobaculum zhutongyuii]
MSTDYAKKLLTLRKSTGVTQKKFSEITGLALGTIKKYETGQQGAGIAIVERVISTEEYKKYTMWLLLGETAPESGQVEPDETLTESDSNSKKIG